MFALERTANIKGDPSQMNENDTLGCCSKAVFFNFLASQRKLKEKFLFDLCVSSGAGGESMSNDLLSA